MQHTHRFLVSVVLYSAALIASTNPLKAQVAPTPPIGAGAIDESSLVLLKGNHHPLANPANDRGPAAPDLPMERMLLVLKRDPAAESALRQWIADQQDKTSPRYHAWLSPEEFANRFGPSESDRQKAAAWLVSHGFRVNRISRGGLVIDFSGTAAQVTEAFHTSIHRYLVNGENHYANASDPQIPGALSPIIAGVSTLHDFQSHSTIRVLGSANRIANSSLWQPDFTFTGFGGTAHYLAPGDFAKIYNVASLRQSGINGTGQSIAIVARTNINLSDIQVFRLAFGLPSNDPQIILDGPDPGNFFGLEEAEADLDVEWSGAVAPKATIKLVVSASTNATDGVDLSALYIVDNNLAPILSASFGACEAALGRTETTFINNLWEQAAAQGITVVVASGDSGAAGCDFPEGQPATHGLAVNGLASTPFNVAVGGTQFNENGADSTYWAATNGPDQSSALGYIPETAWNESCADPTQCGFFTLFATGGGPSQLYSKPSWQTGPGVPTDGKRDLPDVSLNAAGQHDGYLLCQDGFCLTDGQGQLIEAEVVGGTSAAAPTFAGIMALVLQKTNSRQGQADFVLYPLAAGQTAANCNASAGPQSTCIFNDTTQGNNSVPEQTGFSAIAGYDMATGLGSVNAANLVADWQNVTNTFRATTTALQLTPGSVTHGQPVTASVTVAPVTGTGTPTGGVALLTGGPQTVNLGSLTSGSISSPVTTLPGGSYSVTASYGGDGTFGASVSSGVPLTVNPEPSKMTFTSSAASTTFSNFLFLEVSVSGVSQQGAATGTVSFSDTFNGSTTNLLTAPLNVQGNASVTVTSLAIGSHSLNASYSGDPSFQPSSAGPVSVTITKGTTETFLFAPTGALPNSPVTLEAIVFPNGTAGPTGTVQFLDGTTALGNPVQIQNLFAVITVPQLANGTHSITAVYSGDSNFNGSTSPPSKLFVGIPDFQIAVNPGNLTVTAAAPGRATVLLSPGPGIGFFGNVSFACSGLPAGATCSFQPTQLLLDGFDSMTTALTITRSAQASLRAASTGPLRKLPLSLGGLSAAACLFLFVSCRKRRSGFLCAILVLICSLGVCAGCGGSSSSAAPPGPPPQTATIVTVTASGGSGTLAVSHSVTLAVTLQ